jgi:CSLREA domain-containing protein
MSTNYALSGARRTRRALTLVFGLAVTLALLSLFGSHSAKPAHAATPPFTVNSTGDENDLDFPGGTFDGSSDDRCDVDAAVGGQCTLRAAIQAANTRAGADTIRFRISGNGPHTITPAREFPPITRPVTIDGYTQGDSTTGTTPDDATENTLTQPGQTNAVLKIVLHGKSGENYCYGLYVAANSVMIRGLVINNFEFCGAANSSSAPGIRLSGAGHRIEGNFIGTDADGTTPDRNARGISLIDANNSTIGGTSPEDRNLISGNVRSGVEVSVSSGSTIRNNLIGPDKSGQPLTAASNAVQGGVAISSGTGNRILSNSIFSNGPLGIDLSDGGREQDFKDTDTGANRKQNFPVITSAQSLGTFTSISGTLHSTPSTATTARTFIIQFFSNPPIPPPSTDLYEGKTFLGQTQVTTNRQGNATFTFSPSQTVPVGQVITATATRKDTGDTSEFSAARRVEEPVIGGS